MHESHIIRWAEYHVTQSHWRPAFTAWTRHLAQREEARLALILSGIVDED